MILAELKDKIKRKEARLAVIGLGYVGLPVACEFARAGFEVLGVELRPDRVETINAGISPMEGNEPGLAELLAQVIDSGKFAATNEYGCLRDRDIFLIAVETPVDDQNIPRYEALRAALCSLGPVLKNGAMVIVESTIAPGTMDRVVKPLLGQTSGKVLNEGFFLGNCPERVMPGRLLNNLRNVSRVVGGMTPETAETMIALYRNIVQADLDPADCVTAELVKTAENAYRDVQIAFANEVALICEAVGGDAWKVRELVNKSPGRHMLLPGAGVGGHCIPKDPWLLAYGAADINVPVRLIPAARSVNNYMPIHMAELVEEALAVAGKPLAGSRILVLGYAYLEDSDDSRNSPSEMMVQFLAEQGAVLSIHDPYIPEYCGPLEEKAYGCDAVVFMVRHREYLELNLDQLKRWLRTPVLVDGRGVFNPDVFKGKVWIYRAVGRDTG